MENKSDKLKNIKWINWTEKSSDVQFKSQLKGVGDGEQKVALELDTVVLGQNSCFDMKIKLDDINYECDVKKLDNNTFNTGVKGRNALRPIKIKISNLFNSFENIIELNIFTDEEIKLLQHIKNLSPDELCVSNLKQLNHILHMLHNKRNEYMKTIPMIKPLMKKDGTLIEMNLLDYYNICLILNEDIPDEYDIYKKILKLLNIISHEYIKNPDALYQSLNDLTNIFSEQILIFVDEKKGYYILHDISKIKFERITRGHPRFRLI